MIRLFKGSTLMEALIALGVAAVGLFALIQISTKSVANSNTASKQAIATAYANQALELVRLRRRQMDWATFKAQFAGGRCGVDLTSASGGCQIPGTDFTSRVTLQFQTYTAPPREEALVNAEVWWTEGNESANRRQMMVSQQTVIARY